MIRFSLLLQDTLKRRRSKRNGSGFSFKFALFVALIGITVGLLLNLSLSSPPIPDSIPSAPPTDSIPSTRTDPIPSTPPTDSIPDPIPSPPPTDPMATTLPTNHIASTPPTDSVPSMPRGE
ncbi:hypothetical protein AgCh_033657 [Apium graveolens]